MTTDPAHRHGGPGAGWYRPTTQGWQPITDTEAATERYEDMRHFITDPREDGRTMDEVLRELGRTCRTAVNHEVYGGDAPNDSNALTEVWPTATGAAFMLERHGRSYAVIVAPADAVSDLVRPDYTHT